ncbi:rod shape-determining protein MreD [Treponema brennaborense]|uniref:Rod shape-determining protein MreD n=1 Tax=Treponema brennaborense (strain DSM 12168 / CIP 105900 / DD5/3) TaxID=906968 RepID=F4LMN4_TREBD|nr:rod shape-determining protein MreD [Treponema brennaborense]AEE16781.1 rod shape-determining protein MreD [Treponema brennaborense DSM 12168]
MIRAFVSSLFLLLLCALVETALLSNIMLLPAVPDLLLITVLFVSVYNGSLLGETAGFCSGLFLDFLSAAPLGLNCLLRTVIGFAAGLFHKSLNVSGFMIPAVLGFIATVFKALLLYVVSFFFPNGVIAYDLFSAAFVFELTVNTLLTPAVFAFLRLFASLCAEKTL